MASAPEASENLRLSEFVKTHNYYSTLVPVGVCGGVLASQRL
jgi:hypothetical protein